MAAKVNGLVQLLKLSGAPPSHNGSRIALLLPALTIYKNLTIYPSKPQNVPSTEGDSAAKTAIKGPSRKGRQAAGRFLKLLAGNTEDAQIQQALQLLKNSPEKISSAQAALLISKIGDPLMVYDFYRFLKAQIGFEPREVLYAALIDTQVRSINPKPYKIKFYFDEMRKRDLKFKAKEYSMFFSSFLPVDIELADICYNLMKLTGTREVENYNFVINACLNQGFYDKAISLLDQMRAERISFSSETYYNILRIYKNMGNAKEAMKIFIEMENNRILPTEDAYNLLLSVVASARQVKVASAIFKEMMFLGFKADDRSSGDLTRAYLKENMVNEVDSMVRDGSLTNPDDFSQLIKAFTDRNLPLRAIEILGLMQESRVKIGDVDYARVIHASVKAGLIEEAIKVYNTVKRLDRVTDESIDLAMLCVFCKAEMQNSAENLFKEMVSKGSLKREEAYLYMMTLYGNLGRLEDVMRIFQSMKQNGCNVSVDAYSVLIDVMGKAGRLNRARDLLLEMRMSQLQPNNAIYSTLISASMSVGLLDRALSYIDEFKDSGLQPDGVTAGTIAIVLVRAHKYADLEIFVNELVRWGVKFPKDKGIFLMDLCSDTSVSDKIVQLIE